jgi:hypothetical protein
VQERNFPIRVAKIALAAERIDIISNEHTLITK